MTNQAALSPPFLRPEKMSQANDSMPKSLARNSAFKPVKPENVARPQGIKPPPPRKTK